MIIHVREHRNESAGDGLAEALKKALPKVESEVASRIKPVADNGDWWLNCEVSGTLDERVTETDDPEYYDLDLYEPEDGESKVVAPELRYYLSVYPGYYDDDGKYKGDWNLDTVEFLVDIEVCPAGEDFHVEVKYWKGNSPMRKIFSLSFDPSDVDYGVERIIEAILDELTGMGLSD